MEIIRCSKCHKKLAEAIYSKLAIKCGRCKAINAFSKSTKTNESAQTHAVERSFLKGRSWKNQQNKQDRRDLKHSLRKPGTASAARSSRI